MSERPRKPWNASLVACGIAVLLARCQCQPAATMEDANAQDAGTPAFDAAFDASGAVADGAMWADSGPDSGGALDAGIFDSGSGWDAGVGADAGPFADAGSVADSGTPADGGSDAGLADGGGLDAGPIGGSRPVTLHVPTSYVPGVPMPLVVMLHGYGSSGALEESYLGLTALSDGMGFLYAYPDGTIDAIGQHFWNATDACCNLFGSSVDDSSYLSGVVAEIEQRYTVDPKKVFFIGHSNGGFMSYRMACDHADQIAAIASLAGAMWADVTKCAPVSPVSMVEIHGTSDLVISYDGGAIGGHPYPAAATTVADWIALDGCSTTPDSPATYLDLDSSISGYETTVTSYSTGCSAGGHAELWTIQGGSHVPTLSSTFDSDVIGFLFAHPKP